MSTNTIQLIVGLGNPGAEYEATRHNAGVWFVETLAQQHAVNLSDSNKFHGLCGRIKLADHDCHLLIPTTYMNLSGDAVQALAHYYKIPSESILVVHDELDLDCGTVRLKYDGGHGGHNGLRDIMQKINSRQFYRLRLGIGHPNSKAKVVGYVLNKPSVDERIAIDESIDVAIKQLPLCFKGQFEKAMQRLHTTKKIQKAK